MATTSLHRVAGPGATQVVRATENMMRKLKKVDPRERYVLLIPDSDRVHVGMGFKLLNVPPSEKVFEKASDILQKDILKLCLDGPKTELLASKENRNVAAFVTTHATLAKLEYEEPETAHFCKAAGGIGVGFVNALVFGGGMSFENGLDLVKRQGQAMDRAAKIIPSARVKVRFMPATNKYRVCRAATDHCISMGIPEEVAVCNITKQSHAHVLEIAGHEEAINYLETEGQRLFNFRWIDRVQSTPQAFHTHLMKPAEDFLRAYVTQRLRDDPDYIREPASCCAYSSNAGRKLRAVRDIKKDLITYPVRPIKIEQLLHELYHRPRSVPQPNTLVLWQRGLLDTLERVNRLARVCAKVYV